MNGVHCSKSPDDNASQSSQSAATHPTPAPPLAIGDICSDTNIMMLLDTHKVSRVRGASI